MLEVLRIKNFVLIREEEICFSSGLNVITGETGAGKSIVLQALQLILGARPKPGLIRKGADSWEIEALFNISGLSTAVRQGLPEVARESDEQLVLYRSVGQNGRSRAQVNGKLAPVSTLEEIATALIHICGQGAFITLLDPRQHLATLDAFADIEKELQAYRKVFSEYHERRADLERRTRAREQGALRRAELEYVVEELSQLQLKAGKRAELEDAVNILGSSETRIESASQIEELITEDNGALDKVYAIQSLLMELYENDSALVEGKNLIESVVAELGELSSLVSRYRRDIDVDPAELEARRDELAQIARLERKFHMDDAGLLDLLERSTAELLELDDSASLESLEKEVASLLAKVMKAGTVLDSVRKKKASRLSTLVATELADLNMPDARVLTSFETCEPNELGISRAEFLVVTNAGQDPKPMRQIASGGELSRILLVLKKILRDRTGVNVLVFDEVDSGVSGKVARAMGEKLKALSHESQVLCITHLAQVASLADAHFVVSKASGKSAETSVSRLSDEKIVDEIARMLAGYKVTDTSRASARELLAS